MTRELERSLGVPEGYITGLPRDTNCESKLSHLYKGDFHEPGLPMCSYGWNRDGGEAYSIFRGNIGRGICKICMKRAKAGLSGVEPKGWAESKAFIRGIGTALAELISSDSVSQVRILALNIAKNNGFTMDDFTQAGLYANDLAILSKAFEGTPAAGSEALQ